LAEQDIRAVSAVTGAAGVLLKVILETCQLSREQVARATDLAARCGADFVKTSTGFSTEGATEEAVRTMVEAAEGRINVKASGGIRDMEKAERFVEMGCSRLGVNYTTAAALCGAAGSGSGGDASEY
jgi:deoxyribose-phosphate aldolase